ncbi:hypothetical protein SAMN02745975_00919 [Geosporobacter subterraneus DSM 17957]|uniref:Uncharacterized protein n=1 Tax=Geosporobacter subterraneus DSM 17957 TaxID=1121919 RepID=A0A1M6F5N3_9FIRM|nr:hypothetical protein [Geosporobacter subterraneus]SHI93015.1 hypothetical protein SAMN02745975_00919 [Geosporobacter subterraneus DSM 17957]
MAMAQMKNENNEVVLKEQKQQDKNCAAVKELHTKAYEQTNSYSVNYWGAGSKADELCWDLCWD